MIAILNFITLTFATTLAAATAFVLQWLLLQATLQAMRPAASHRPGALRPQLVLGTAQTARAFSARR
jgi:hypothetical protein